MIVLQNDNVLADRVSCADSFFSRLKGLMFRRELSAGEGLLLKNCSSIHTCFMRFTIDVIYLSGKNTVLYTETVRPWRCGKHVKGTKHVLELTENAAKDIRLGEVVAFRNTSTVRDQ